MCYLVNKCWKKLADLDAFVITISGDQNSQDHLAISSDFVSFLDLLCQILWECNFTDLFCNHQKQHGYFYLLYIQIAASIAVLLNIDYKLFTYLIVIGNSQNFLITTNSITRYYFEHGQKNLWQTCIACLKCQSLNGVSTCTA